MNINVEKCDKHPAQHNNVYQFTVADSLAQWAEALFPFRSFEVERLEISWEG